MWEAKGREGILISNLTFVKVKAIRPVTIVLLALLKYFEHLRKKKTFAKLVKTDWNREIRNKFYKLYLR